MIIQKIKTPLTDGSYVYEVEISDMNVDEVITFNARTEKDADTLLSKFYELIGKHTCNMVKIYE